MAIRFNADEILQMAIRIEQNGAAFYRKAAQKKKGQDGFDFLLKLAEMEEEHERTFATMRDELDEREAEATTWDPFGETALYLEAMADGHPGEGAPSVADSLTGEETLPEILRTAIGLEKESILFYLGLRDMVPQGFGRDRVDRIIDEERSHIVTLTKELKGL